MTEGTSAGMREITVYANKTPGDTINTTENTPKAGGKHPKRTEAGKLVRFMTVGASGTAIDFALLTLLKEALGFPTLVANSFSFSAGLLNNFTWNRLWTFADVRNSSIARQFMQFAVVSLFGLLLNNFIVLMLEAPLGALLGSLFGVQNYGYLAAKVLATGVAFLWNFTANRYWTFNSGSTQVQHG